MGGVFNTLDDGCNVTRSVALHHRYRHDECSRIGTDDADVIVGSSGNTSTVGSVHVVVTNLRRLVDEVPTVHVACKTIIVVVVTLYAILLFLVGPDVVLQVRVGNINTRVKDGDDGATAIDDGLVPQFLDAIAVESPLLSQIGVAAIAVSNMLFCHDVHFVVRLGKLDFLKGCQALH